MAAFFVFFLVDLLLVRIALGIVDNPWWYIVRDGGFVLISAGILYRQLARTAVRVARSEEKLALNRERQRVTENLLHVLNLRILQGQPLAESLETVCARLVESFGYDLVWIGRKEPTGEMAVRAAAGPARGFLDSVTIRWDDAPGGEGPVGEAVRTGQPHAMTVDQPGCDHLREHALRFGIRSGAAVPLVVAGEMLGTLSVCSASLDTFEGEDFGRLQAFADEVAMSISAALHQERLHLQTVALESASNAILLADKDGVIQWVNPAFTTLTGFTAAESLGRTPRFLKSGAHGDAFYRALWDTIGSGRTWRGEIYNQRKDGSVYVEDQTITPVRSVSGEVTHYIAIKSDVTTRRQQEAEIRQLSEHDPVTDLPNRRVLLERLERATRRARHEASGALLIVDIDEFHVVVDAVGPLSADSILVNVASQIAAALRPGDFLAHLGSDEFAVVFEKTPFDDALQVAGRIRERISDTRFPVGDRHFDISVHAGLALVDGSLDAEAVLALANSALLSAQDGSGTGIVAHRRPEDRLVQVGEASQWAARIKDALATDHFRLDFQPVVPLGRGRKVHHEALLRMTDMGTEVIRPGSFLPAAERFGLMPRVDEWVVSRALDVLEERPDVELFVNLSGKSLGDEALFSHVESRLRAAGATARRLTFEITETAAISDLIATQRWIRHLKELGCSFALDDFGIGFSSLSYLRALAVDYVKVDGSFIRGLDTDPTNRALVKAVRDVAHVLGKEVIAECVETAAVARTLAEMGIEYGQGYYWGFPGPELAAPTSSSVV